MAPIQEVQIPREDSWSTRQAVSHHLYWRRSLFIARRYQIIKWVHYGIRGPEFILAIILGQQKAIVNCQAHYRSGNGFIGFRTVFRSYSSARICEGTLQREVDLVVFQDNSAVIQIVDSGYSPKLRRLKKVFKINIGSVHEWFKENTTSRLLFIKTALQRVDPFTKPLPVAKWLEALERMNVLVVPLKFLQRSPTHSCI